MASQVAHLVKNPPPMQETPVRFLGVEYPLEKGTATHASILAWKSPWTYSTWNVYTHSCIFYRFGQNVMSCLHHYSIIQSNFVCVCVCVCAHAPSCLTLWDPMDCSPPGSSVHRIFQARTLVWVANSFSKGSSDPGNKPESYVSCIGRQFLFYFCKKPLGTIYSSLSTLPTRWQPLYFYCLNNFAFSRIPSSQNNKVWLASFT